MCNIWDLYKGDPGLAANELTSEDIEKFIVNNLNDLSDLRNVGFTGGDPLLMRKDFVQIIKLFRTHLSHAQLGVQTNGLIPELAISKLKEIISFYPQFSIAVSIDGLEQSHAKIRGIKGAFEKATKTIKEAQAIGIKYITCGMTLNKHNYKDIKAVKRYVDSLGGEFSCFQAETADYFNNKEKISLALDEQACSEVVKQLKDECSYNYFMDNLRMQIQGKRKRELPCYSGFTSLVIDPYGNVKPCILKTKGINDDIFGNIKTTPLKAMLTSQRALVIRNHVKKCSCWCQCEVSTSAIFAPFDVMKWFIFYCPDKKGFILNILNKHKRIKAIIK